MKIKKMSKKKFVQLADEYIKEISGVTADDYYRWTLLVQAILEDPETRCKLDKFEWSDANWDATGGNQGDELNSINGVPFVLGYAGSDSSSLYLTFIIYHDGDRFQVYLGEDANTPILDWHPEKQENFILMYVAKFINNWQII